MNIHRLAIAVTAINLTLIVLTVSQSVRTSAQTVPQTLRAHALELVDEHGQVRSRLNVESSGEVVLRLFDQKGTIRVKLGAGEDGSGLLLADETTEPGIHMIARQTGTSARPTTTSITLKGKDGQQRVVTP